MSAARGRAKRAEQQVFLDRQFGEEPAPLGHQADAEIDDLLGGAADEIDAARRRSRR